MAAEEIHGPTEPEACPAMVLPPGLVAPPPPPMPKAPEQAKAPAVAAPRVDGAAPEKPRGGPAKEAFSKAPAGKGAANAKAAAPAAAE